MHNIIGLKLLSLEGPNCKVDPWLVLGTKFPILICNIPQLIRVFCCPQSVLTMCFMVNIFFPSGTVELG